ncbi:MAG: SAM-dependent methyltransferase [Salibacteraceae bacterium]|jgi:SAM-dependent methyltransferase
MNLKFDKEYWNSRYINKETGWDLGSPSRPLKEYIDTITDKSVRILIPGAGNAYEAEYLHSKGFENVTVIDISEEACRKLKNRIPDFPIKNIICADFFKTEGVFDVMLEQTFFCAIDPSERMNYIEKANQILQPNGVLVGLLFQKELFKDHPPFGGDEKIYRKLFEPLFNIHIMKTAHNSIEPRKNSELFIKMSPK